MTDGYEYGMHSTDILSVAASVALCGAQLLYMQEGCNYASTASTTQTYIDMKGYLRLLREAVSQ